MTKNLRWEEEWARAVIQQALGVSVVQHDDGSAPRMYDLEILHDDRPPAAVEVVAAADPASIELWNILSSGGRWQAEGIEGEPDRRLRPPSPARVASRRDRSPRHPEGTA